MWEYGSMKMGIIGVFSGNPILWRFARHTKARCSANIGDVDAPKIRPAQPPSFLL